MFWSSQTWHNTKQTGLHPPLLVNKSFQFVINATLPVYAFVRDKTEKKILTALVQQVHLLAVKATGTNPLTDSRLVERMIESYSILFRLKAFLAAWDFYEVCWKLEWEILKLYVVYYSKTFIFIIIFPNIFIQLSWLIRREWSSQVRLCIWLLCVLAFWWVFFLTFSLTSFPY